MKKKLILRGLMGFPIGMAIGQIVTIIISLIFGEGRYLSVRPELAEAAGSEINAVILQALLCGVIGSGFSMASLVWEKDSWSIAKQSVIYFALISAVMFPAAYAANWMEHSVKGAVSYILIFIGIFLAAWAAQYIAWRAKIKKLNAGVKNMARK